MENNMLAEGVSCQRFEITYIFLSRSKKATVATMGGEAKAERAFCC
jgi:hypothetical protein